MKKHVWVSSIFLIVGGIGILFCLFTQNFQDSGKNYTNNWQFTNEEFANLDLSSEKNVAINIEEADVEKPTVTISGKLSNREIQDLKPTSSKNSTEIKIGTFRTWLERWHLPAYGTQKVRVKVPKDYSFKTLSAKLNNGNVHINELTGEGLSIRLSNGDFVGEQSAFKNAKITTNSAGTDLTNWTGNIALVSSSGNQIVKDSTGDFSLHNSDGMSQVHRQKAEKGEIDNTSGKVITTRIKSGLLTIDSQNGTNIIEQLEGKLFLTSLNGKSILRANYGEQIVESKNGDIIVEENAVSGNMNIKSENGLIKMTLSNDYHQEKFQIVAPHGQVTSDFLWQDNAKNATVKIQTLRGEVKVLEGDA
ncbi:MULTISPECIES: DUF4097 family beta strand repeat-containing protein [Listeria]|uniref:DUF4097 family beta strand repeat-containing protein n=1 Tax=Listeria TaxID=1637 RepID=UPI000B597E32|nr:MULTISPECIES: DUF4097 family beta strand repeat-containing protein [Listeria]